MTIVKPTRQLNCAEAIAALHEGYPQEPDADEPRIVVHSYLGAIGCDWDRDDAVRAIHENPQSLMVADPSTLAWKLDHRLVIVNQGHANRTPLFLETWPGAFA